MSGVPASSLCSRSRSYTTPPSCHTMSTVPPPGMVGGALVVDGKILRRATIRVAIHVDIDVRRRRREVPRRDCAVLMEERADDVDVGAEPRHVGGGGKRANHKALDAGLGLPRLLLLKCRAQQLVRYLAALLMRNHTHFAQAFAPHQLVRMVLGRGYEDQRPELVAAVLLHQLTQ
eukprot:2231432-Pleurochrysis_carterae.AAC.2